MNCPVCDRLLAPTLSICPACGTMMNDTVREELQTKITLGVSEPMATVKKAMPKLDPSPKLDAPARPAIISPTVKPKAVVTAGLNAAKTSPTLVEFQNKNTSLPDWRLQIQNAVQQRRGGNTTAIGRALPTQGATALKAEAPPVEEPPRPELLDRRVANAMERIDRSRATFSIQAAAPIRRPAIAKPPQKAFPFDVVAQNERPKIATRPSMQIDRPAKPKLVVPTPTVKKPDTNKLPPVDQIIERVIPIEEIKPVETLVDEKVEVAQPTEFAEIKRIQIRAEGTEIEDAEIYDDEIEDLAPFSMRFGAGLFDLILGAFVTMLVLSPFAFGGGDWFTMSGALIAIATWALVQFVYMTASLGLVGKTFGMRLFALELVDAVENEYPTLHQAAISSSLFIVSLGLGGAGFLTLFFNEERRAVHDLVSGTILVRQF